MRNTVCGDPLPKRLEYFERLNIGKKDNNPNKISEYLVKYQNTPMYLPIFAVPLTLPKYRLANGRTKARQEEYIAKNPDIPDDFFARDLESESALVVQHEILKSLITKTDKEKDLLTFFKKNIQDEPLILDSKGFVINGNRRLCAFRELFLSDSIAYKHFENIKVVILPEGTEKEIDELEALLQIAPDIKEDYSWIAKACMIRSRQKEHNYSEKELSALYGLKEVEIRDTLAKLQCAERFLKQYNLDKQYSEVEKDDYAFNQIRSGYKSIKPSTPDASFLQSTLENLSFKAIKHSEKIDLGRNYSVINSIYSLADDLIKTLKNELLDDTTNQLTDASANNIDDDLFGFTTEDTQNTALINEIQNPQNDEATVEIIKCVILADRETRASKDLKTSALKHLKKAHSELIEASSCLDKGSEITGVENQLCEIETYIAEIRRKCNND